VGAIDPGKYDLSEEDVDDRREGVGDWDPEAFDLERVKKWFDK